MAELFQEWIEDLWVPACGRDDAYLSHLILVMAPEVLARQYLLIQHWFFTSVSLK